MTDPFRLLRDALGQLGLDSDEQRRELSGTVVTDELALDLANAVESLGYAHESAGLRLPGDGFGDLLRYAPGTHAGILVLRLNDNLLPGVRATLERLLQDVAIGDLAGCVAALRDGDDLRIRRPTTD